LNTRIKTFCAQVDNKSSVSSVLWTCDCNLICESNFATLWLKMYQSQQKLLYRWSAHTKWTWIFSICWPPSYSANHNKRIVLNFQNLWGSCYYLMHLKLFLFLIILTVLGLKEGVKKSSETKCLNFDATLGCILS